VSPDRALALRQNARAEVEPFTARMGPEHRERSIQIAFERQVRNELRLPVIAFE
jgi:hypothetical protein